MLVLPTNPERMKVSLFEYFLKHLIEWYCQYYKIHVQDFNDHPKNNLSKIKIFKLHFFACSTDNDALDIFDNFHALPYGHVESTIYDNLDKLTFFKIDNTRLTILSDLEEITGTSPEQNAIIDKMIVNIERKNFELISFNPFDLVEISHRWFSWNFTFQEARKIGLYSKAISPSLIKQEVKYYSN
jgi:hypothetical protein